MIITRIPLFDLIVSLDAVIDVTKTWCAKTLADETKTFASKSQTKINDMSWLPALPLLYWIMSKSIKQF